MKTEIEWHYLPELPEMGANVLLALNAPFTRTFEGWFNDATRQFGIGEDSACAETTEEVYAWADLPKPPPKKENK